MGEVLGQTDVGLLREELEGLTGVEGEGQGESRVRNTYNVNGFCHVYKSSPKHRTKFKSSLICTTLSNIHWITCTGEAAEPLDPPGPPDWAPSRVSAS